MEHRWGQRIAARQPLMVKSGRDVVVMGILMNASLSGAYVATSAPVKRDQRVDLQLGSALETRVSGFIVRADEWGVGLEWEEFASDAVQALLLTIAHRTWAPLYAPTS
jgi:hypothetical protein